MHFYIYIPNINKLRVCISNGQGEDHLHKLWIEKFTIFCVCEFLDPELLTMTLTSSDEMMTNLTMHHTTTETHLQYKFLEIKTNLVMTEDRWTAPNL